MRFLIISDQPQEEARRLLSQRGFDIPAEPTCFDLAVFLGYEGLSLTVNQMNDQEVWSIINPLPIKIIHIGEGCGVHQQLPRHPILSINPSTLETDPEGTISIMEGFIRGADPWRRVSI